MTLQEAADNIGEGVIYRHNPACTLGCAEHGVITAVTSRYVFVRYDGDGHSKATVAGQLELAGSG